MDQNWNTNGSKKGPIMDHKWVKKRPIMDENWIKDGWKLDQRWIKKGPIMDFKMDKNGPKNGWKSTKMDWKGRELSNLGYILPIFSLFQHLCQAFVVGISRVIIQQQGFNHVEIGLKLTNTNLKEN